MDPPTNQTITSPEHIINISQNRNNHNNNNNTASSSSSNYNIAQSEFSVSDSSEESPSSSNQAPIQNQNNRRRSPLNSGLWISVELLVNLAQIITAIIVLSISTKEHSKTRLFGWVIGYTVGCALTLPHLYWRFVHRNRNSVESAQNTSQNNNNDNNLAESSNNNNNNNNNINNSYTAVSANTGSTRSYIITTNPRVHALVDHFKMALDCFFAIWFVVGNVWIFGSRSASSDAPNLYRLCIVFLTFSCIGYAMPFILCAMICCCLPCIISIMGYREMSPENRGASQDSINALPILKFKLKRFNSNDNLNGEIDGGGILSAGTEHEQIVSSEDAVCCICLAKYGDNEELRELPCMHFFHKDCVDKWLKINALCPLCKAEVPVSSTGPLGLNFGRRHSDRRVQSQS